MNAEARIYSSEIILGLLGVIFVLIGWFALPSSPHLSPATIAVGTSLVAGSIGAVALHRREAQYRVFMSSGIAEVWKDRSHIPDASWTEWLSKAENRCVLLGVASARWLEDPSFETVLKNRLKNGVNVRMYFLDPHSEAAGLRGKEERARSTKQAIATTIRRAWSLRERLRSEVSRRLEIYVYRTTPSFAATWVDSKFMIVTHYLPAYENLNCPAFELQPASDGLYETYEYNIDQIMERYSVVVSESNIDSYTKDVPEGA